MKNLLLALVLVAGTSAMAQNQLTGVSVNGEGAVTVAPDQALIKIRIEHDGASASEVKKATDNDVDATLKFLKKYGIASKYIQTEYLRLNKTYDYNTKEYKYNSEQAISVKLTAIEDYEKVVSGLFESGTNRIDGVEFLSSEMEKHEAEARKRAIKDAKTKAGEYAEALGQKIGPATSISESSSGNLPVYRNLRMKAESSSNDSQQQTIAVGEMEVKANVQVTFRLDE